MAVEGRRCFKLAVSDIRMERNPYPHSFKRKPPNKSSGQSVKESDLSPAVICRGPDQDKTVQTLSGSGTTGAGLTRIGVVLNPCCACHRL